MNKYGRRKQAYIWRWSFLLYLDSTFVSVFAVLSCVYTMQPVVQPVVQPAVSCILTFSWLYNRLYSRLYNGLHRVYGVLRYVTLRVASENVRRSFSVAVCKKLDPYTYQEYRHRSDSGVLHSLCPHGGGLA